jgi:hypothetical protein
VEPDRVSELAIGHDRIKALLVEIEQIRSRADQLLVDAFVTMTECRAVIDEAKYHPKITRSIPCRFPELIPSRPEGGSTDWTTNGPVLWPAVEPATDIVAMPVSKPSATSKDLTVALSK